MSENFEDLLRDHYRRAAESIRPDAELVGRYRSAGRPARALPVRASVLLAAAAVALTALVTWGLLRPGHRDVPVTPPPLPTGHTSPLVTPSPSPSPSPSRPDPPGSPPIRRPPSRIAATPVPRPPQPGPRTSAPTARPSARAANPRP